MYEQARPSASVLFSCPLKRACWTCALAEDRRFAAAKRAGFHTIAPPQRRALPLVFSAEKTATTFRASQHSGSPRSLLRGLRSKLKKGLGSVGKACFPKRFQALFHIDCCNKGNNHLPMPTQVLWYFLDARKYRLPFPCVTAAASPSYPP